MIIVLDGPDGTGKTTLAERMCKLLDAEYLHLTYRWKERIFDYHTVALRYAARRQKPIIIDRWWPSEAIYAKAFRDGSDWPLQGRMCDRIAKKFGVIYVYCLPDDVQSAVANHTKLKQQREEMYDDIEAVADLYLKLWNGESTHEDKGQYIDQVIRTGGLWNSPDTVKYSISEWGHCMDLFIERVQALSIAWRTMQLPDLLEFKNWNMTGHAACSDYLIVSDRVKSKYREMHWPCYDYNDSLILTEAIHRLNLPEDLFMYACAQNHDGSPNMLIDRLLEKYDKKIITLGKVAEDYMSNKTIHAALPNPSYEWKVDMVEVLKHAIS